MNSYIPKQPKHIRERIEAKLDERLVRRLEQYCRYLDSDRDYVLAQALELVFRKDKFFAEWRRSQNMEETGKVRSAPQSGAAQPVKRPAGSV